MQSIADKQIYRPYIDGLRGLAVLSVLGVHLPTNFHFPGLEPLVAAGARGVQLFFLLSAFTLFRSSKNKYQKEASPRRNFYIRRFFRIMPLWWISTLVYAIADGRSLANTIPSIFMYFGFIRFDPVSEAFPLGWSIFVEETFYILLPLIFVFISDIKKAFVFFVTLSVLSVVWIKTAALFGIPSTNYFISLFPIAQWPCLALGILIYFISEHPEFDAKFLKNVKLMRWTEAAALLMVCFLYSSNFLVMTIPLALFFLLSISARTLSGKIARLGIIRQFGICCYSIYLFHIVLIRYLEPVRVWCLETLHLTGAPGEIRYLAWFPIFAAINLLFGVICFQLIERPCVDLGKKLIRSLEPRKAGPGHLPVKESAAEPQRHALPDPGIKSSPSPQ